ncbi:hypothetical protein [Flavobacterium sp.]|uniref:hypothetical protein n=1 Tax=Flavobacterium sp. TaxID=239 RepID=UPI002488989D|nr:hypothetical protein [Flavobacterium sp.]MDI1317895.1 hypothetical protein [Flavobacterium sp.]
MKKIFICLFFLMPLVNHSQTIQELYDRLTNKKSSEAKRTEYKEVLNEIVTLNSTSNAFWSGGNSKTALSVKLPIGTIKWYYRVTLMDVRQNYSYNPNESLFSLVSNKHPLFVNNQTSLGVNFYIINDYALSDFYADRNFKLYSDYQNEKTRGFNGICNLTYNNLMICLKNYNLKDGLKAIVEVVAYGKY